jgi:hypothetical protein
MKTTSRNLVVALFVSLLWFGASTAADAAIRVYKITFVHKSTLYPKFGVNGNSMRIRGYVIVDTVNPSDPLGIKLVDIHGKVYSDLGDLGLVIKRQVLNQFQTIDRSGNGKLDTFLMYENGEFDGRTYAGLFSGNIPSKGFKVKGVPFTDEARSLKYRGAMVGTNVDFWRRTATLRLDPIVVDNPQLSVGLQWLALKARLDSKGYSMGF